LTVETSCRRRRRESTDSSFAGDPGRRPRTSWSHQRHSRPTRGSTRAGVGVGGWGGQQAPTPLIGGHLGIGVPKRPGARGSEAGQGSTASLSSDIRASSQRLTQSSEPWLRCSGSGPHITLRDRPNLWLSPAASPHRPHPPHFRGCFPSRSVRNWTARGSVDT
jgi:hypothetical protein